MLIYFVLVTTCPVVWPAESGSEPILYLAKGDSNSVEIFAIDSNAVIPARPNLVIATHGWYEKEPWSEELILAIKSKVDSEKWLCGWFDWREQANVINPTDAAKYARDTAGPMLGEKIIQLSKNFRHIHLIGHSAGSWLVSEAAKVIAKETDVTIHLTFLDAYVPPFWDEGRLGDLGNEPNIIYWADHYFTSDITLGATEKILTNAHNVDLTKITPGINDHKFPHYWYHATVIGQYAAGRRYEGKKLFCRLGDIEYGFARSLEAGWQRSTQLEMGNKAVKLKKPKKTLKLLLKELFKKR